MTDTANTATGLAGAAQSFEALLAGGNPDLNVPEVADAPNEAFAEQAEALQGEVEGDETADVSEEVEAAPEGDTAADDESSESAEPEVQLVTVTVDGKTQQIPLEEAVKGYQRQADYSRKTAALAEDRRSLENERNAVVQERAQYAQLLGALQAQLQTLQPQEPDWQKLYDTDPVEWVRQREVWRDLQERRAAAQSESQRLQALQQRENQSKLASQVQDNRQKMLEAVPQWKDSAKWEADRSKILNYGKKLGFTDEELTQTYDHRAVVALYKAMQYDSLTANKPRPVVNNGPRSAPAGSSATAPKGQTEVTRAKQRLAKTGKVADAAILFEGFFDS